MNFFNPNAEDQSAQAGAELIHYLNLDAKEISHHINNLSEPSASAIVTQAIRHGIGPFLRHRLITLGLFNFLPSFVREELNNQYFANCALSMVRYQQLGNLLEQLTQNNIPVIALKGIYLAEACYTNPELRPMGDIDLLIQERDLESVQAILFMLGYTREGAGCPVSEYVNKFHQLPAFTRTNSSAIEIHMHIERPQSPFLIDQTALWQRAHPWELNGQQVLCLSTEDLLLHLCLHAIYHHRFRIGLKGLIDIALVIDTLKPDWNILIQRAYSWKAEVVCYLGLSLAKRLVSAEIPAHVLFELKPDTSMDVDAILAFGERTILYQRTECDKDNLFKKEQGMYFDYLSKITEMNELSSKQARLIFLVKKAFPNRMILENRYPVFKGSGWVRVMYSVHWLSVSVRFVRAMGLNLQHWRRLRKLGSRWLS